MVEIYSHPSNLSMRLLDLHSASLYITLGLVLAMLKTSIVNEKKHIVTGYSLIFCYAYFIYS